MVEKDLVDTVEVLLIWARMYRKKLFEEGDFKHRLLHLNILDAERKLEKKERG